MTEDSQFARCIFDGTALVQINFVCVTEHLKMDDLYFYCCLPTYRIECWRWTFNKSCFVVYIMKYEKVNLKGRQ